VDISDFLWISYLFLWKGCGYIFIGTDIGKFILFFLTSIFLWYIIIMIFSDTWKRYRPCLAVLFPLHDYVSWSDEGTQCGAAGTKLRNANAGCGILVVNPCGHQNCRMHGCPAADMSSGGHCRYRHCPVVQSGVCVIRILTDPSGRENKRRCFEYENDISAKEKTEK